MRLRRGAWAWLAALPLLGAGHARAQTRKPEPPSFEAGIELTNLNVSVREGRTLVGGLTQAEFAVYVDWVAANRERFGIG